MRRWFEPRRSDETPRRFLIPMSSPQDFDRGLEAPEIRALLREGWTFSPVEMVGEKDFDSLLVLMIPPTVPLVSPPAVAALLGLVTAGAAFCLGLGISIGSALL